MQTSAYLALAWAVIGPAACAAGSTVDAPAGADGTIPPLAAPTSGGSPVPPSPGDASAAAESGATDSSAPSDASTPDTSVSDATPPPTTCPGYAAPSEVAGCKCATGKVCDANNCYGGYYCELSVTPPKCVPKPASCP